MTRKGGGENDIIKLNPSVNEPEPSTDIQCSCGRSFASIKGMRIHRTKMGCQVDNDVNLNPRLINRLKWTRVRRTTTVVRITLFVNLMHPVWKGMQFALIGLKRMTIDGRSSMKRCPLFSETAWEDLLEWNYILSLKLFMQFALSILELKMSKKEKNITNSQ